MSESVLNEESLLPGETLPKPKAHRFTGSLPLKVLTFLLVPVLSLLAAAAIFAGALMNVRKKDGEMFRYIDGLNFKSKAEFDEYCANILDRSTFYSPDVDLKYGDELLTMSTCIFDYGKQFDMRWVVFARKVRDGEDPTVNTDRAYENPDPLYFEKFYTYYGGSWGGRKWPAELIQGYTY